MNTAKGKPLTRAEVQNLIPLVEAHPVIFSKATNAGSNRLKDEAWLKITKQFNSIIASRPRKPEQLRLKWENLKKNARKRSTRIQMNNLKTNGDKDFIPPNSILDRVTGILRRARDSYSVQGDDVCITDSDEVQNTLASTTSKGKLKRQAIAGDVTASIIKKNEAIAAYYEAKRNQDEEISVLKKRKLELEILEQEKKIESNL